MINLSDTKIIFIDIDGTLTNSKKEITNTTKEIIKKVKEKGIYIILCSGRPNTYTIEKSQEVNASNIVISNNGCLVYDYVKKEVIYKNEIEKENLRRIFEFCNNNGIGCAFNSTLERYKNIFCDKVAKEIELIDNISEPIYQLVLDTKKYADVIKIKDYIKNSETFEISNCSKSVLNSEKSAEKYEFDIINKNFGKGNAIKILLQYLKIPKKESICFGDHINDKTMFKECGFTIAMENAMEELKEKADFITKSNDDNGVAEFLKKNFKTN